MKVDGRSLRKMNGANNPNASFSWREAEKIRRESKTLPHYGGVKVLTEKYKTTRQVIWKILTKQSYLKRFKKKENINALISEWVGL